MNMYENSHNILPVPRINLVKSWIKYSQAISLLYVALKQFIKLMLDFWKNFHFVNKSKFLKFWFLSDIYRTWRDHKRTVFCYFIRIPSFKSESWWPIILRVVNNLLPLIAILDYLFQCPVCFFLHLIYTSVPESSTWSMSFQLSQENDLAAGV